MSNETISDSADCLPPPSTCCTSLEPLRFLVHEIRNSLACIESAIETLLLLNATDHSTVKLYRMIQRQIEHTNYLMGTLNDRYEAECPLISLRKQECCLADLIDRVVELNEPLISGAGHQFTLSNCEETIRVNADPERFVQIFSNLLQNASKYTPTRGTIELIAQCLGSHASVIVRDNGCGIEPDFLPRIFNLHARSDQVQKSAISGSGVGLALTRQLVEAHHWVIEIDSSTTGSQFTVSMPVFESSANGAPSPIDAAPASVLGGGGVTLAGVSPESPYPGRQKLKRVGLEPTLSVVAVTGSFI